MEIVGWILLALLFLILLVLFVPIRVKAEFTETFRLRVYVFGCIRVWKTDGDEPPSKPKPEKPPKAEPASPAETAKKPKPSLKDELKALKEREGLGGVIGFFKQLLSIATGTLRRVMKYVTVRRISLCVRVGGKEADETAKTYGTVCAALFPVLSALSKVLRIRRKRVLVQPDFLAEAVTVRMRTVLWIWPFGIVGAAVVGLFRIVMTWIKATKAPVGASESINTKAEIRRDL
ncbi:MAG: hypothetical protein IJD01_02100 [Clostridia bacterium]|nr:hypothetical protein [Clostridia bacterium]